MDEPVVESERDMLIRKSRGFQKFGYIWLFAIGAILMIRMLLDPMLLRRPSLAPNLSIGGLVFLGCSLLTFLFAN